MEATSPGDEFGHRSKEKTYTEEIRPAATPVQLKTPHTNTRKSYRATSSMFFRGTKRVRTAKREKKKKAKHYATPCSLRSGFAVRTPAFPHRHFPLESEEQAAIGRTFVGLAPLHNRSKT